MLGYLSKSVEERLPVILVQFLKIGKVADVGESSKFKIPKR